MEEFLTSLKTPSRKQIQHRQVTVIVYNTIDKLKYDTDRLDVRDVTKGPHAVEQTVEPKRDMAQIITQLTCLVPTTRYQVVKI